jgi:hypothetical protein
VQAAKRGGKGGVIALDKAKNAEINKIQPATCQKMKNSRKNRQILKKVLEKIRAAIIIKCV